MTNNSNRTRILSCKKAVNPRHGVTYYATVQSASRPTRVNHVVTGIKIGNAVRFRCSCEAASFSPRTPCRHITATKARLAERKSRRKVITKGGAL